MNKIKIFSVQKVICRVCLDEGIDMFALFRYDEGFGSFAEMLTSCTSVQLDIDNSLPHHICLRCANNLKNAYKFKLLAEESDRKLHKYPLKRSPSKVRRITFNDIDSIKSELVVKQEPQFEIELLSDDNVANVITEMKDEVKLHNTTIKKLDPSSLSTEHLDLKDEPIVLFRIVKEEDENDEFDGDDIWANDDDSDDEYLLPPRKKTKHKFKKPVLENIKVLKRLKAFSKKSTRNGNTTSVTCYPVLQNGEKGKPVVLKRPRDANIVEFSPGIPITKPDTPIEVYRKANVKRIRQVERNMKQKEKLVCPICGILTMNLESHVKTHDEMKKYKCTECNQTFNQKGNMMAHMKKHSGTKDQVCEICGAAFYMRKSLLRHNLIHEGNRPFQCDMCPKSFLVNCDLTRHKKIHAGYKPYKCGACTMAFNAKHQLQAHMRMHTGERPFTCQVCDLNFSYKVNLNNHAMKAHSLNLKFKSIHMITREMIDRDHEITDMVRSAIHSELVGNKIIANNNTKVKEISTGENDINEISDEDVKPNSYSNITIEVEKFQRS